MTSKEIIVHVDKKGLEAIFETNDFSHSLFFSDLETNPKLSQVFILKEDFQGTWSNREWIQTKLLLTYKRNDIK